MGLIKVLFRAAFNNISWHIFCVAVHKNINLKILGKGEESATNNTAFFDIAISVFRNSQPKNDTV
jgi:hypothetical protein